MGIEHAACWSKKGGNIIMPGDSALHIIRVQKNVGCCFLLFSLPLLTEIKEREGEDEDQFHLLCNSM